MDKHFDRLKPLMVDAQRPPHVPQIRLQDWYRSRARGADREAMMSALRDWLTAPVTEGPVYGSMQVAGPPHALARAILGERLSAADALSDWGDRKALAGMKALEDSLRVVGSARTNAQEPLVALREAIRRIEDPEHAGFLVPDGKGRFAIHRRFEDVVAMEFGSDYGSHRGMHSLDQVASRRIWTLLADCRQGDPPWLWAWFAGWREGKRPVAWGTGGHYLVVRFREGLTVAFKPGGPGQLRYSDETRFCRRDPTMLSNPALYEKLLRMAQDDEARNPSPN